MNLGPITRAAMDIAPGGATRLPASLVADVASAVGLVDQSIASIRTVPLGDLGSEATKDARIAAFHLNLGAQHLLEPHFETAEAGLASHLHSADAFLEDANWQLAKRPSPDGRFNGVDVPGALRDSQAAVDLLRTLVHGT